MNLIYYIILLSILFFVLFLIHKTLGTAPKKIKILLTLSLVAVILRTIVLISMCIIKDASLIYYFKYFTNLNYVFVPVIVIILYYINFRFDNMSFNVNYIIASVLSILYLIFIKLSKIIIKVDLNFGYVMELNNKKIINIIVIVLLGALLLTGVLLIDKKNSNKINIILLVCYVFLTIIENLAITMNIWIFPYSIVNEILLMLLINKSLNGFKIK